MEVCKENCMKKGRIFKANTRKYFFMQQITTSWNSLPQDVMDAKIKLLNTKIWIEPSLQIAGSRECTTKEEWGITCSTHTHFTRVSDERHHGEKGYKSTQAKSLVWLTNTQQSFLRDVHLLIKHLQVSHKLKILNTCGVQLTIFWRVLGREMHLQQNV